MRPVGFKFLIQADFVTDSSLQDIVKDSRSNQGLIEGIADAFVEAVLQFCGDEPLRFQWMRYLPDKEDKNLDNFWSSLVQKIVGRLSCVPILYCPKSNDLYLIKDLVRLQRCQLYDDEQPLFDDGIKHQIISQNYEEEDLQILTQYGLRYAVIADVVERARQDVARGIFGRMKSPPGQRTAGTRKLRNSSAYLSNRS